MNNALIPFIILKSKWNLKPLIIRKKIKIKENDKLTLKLFLFMQTAGLDSRLSCYCNFPK